MHELEDTQIARLQTPPKCKFHESAKKSVVGHCRLFDPEMDRSDPLDYEMCTYNYNNQTCGMNVSRLFRDIGRR